MANFKTAFELMIEHEGGYVNDLDDPGGETYKGVARKIHSKWNGWIKIDILKSQSGFPANLDRDQELQAAVIDFYEVQFWNRVCGSLISEQAVANSIFDFAVNAGAGTSAELAQKVVKAKPDGAIGPDTLKAINSFDPDHFIAAFTLEKIKKYVAIVKKRPASMKYFFGWICRALNL